MESALDNLSVRVTHNFTPAAAGGRGGGRGGGPPGGGIRGAGGPGGRGGRGAAQGTSVNMTAQLQYRRNDNDQRNVLPTLGGRSIGTNIGVPVSFNIRHKQTMHAINVNFSSTSAKTRNHYAGVVDVAGLAGITGVSTDPFNWGLPSLSFSTFSTLRDVTPSRRSDRRIALSYNWTRPYKTHQFRVGGDARLDRSESQTDANATGSFTFTGLYTAGAAASGGLAAFKGSGLDFADFLLGLPQQAAVQYGPGNVRMSGKSMSLFFQDDWRQSAKLTLNLGVRYELILPFIEQSGHMVNLDVPPDFSAAVPVQSGADGRVHGQLPRRAVEPRHQQCRAANRRRLSHQARDDSARRLRHQLQRGLVFGDRAAVVDPAALLGDRQRDRHSGGAAAPRRMRSPTPRPA